MSALDSQEEERKVRSSKPANTEEISVVIPVKNQAKIIHKCLEGVFSQSLNPYEVIVVDGHSHDETVAEANRFPIKLVFEDYGSVGGARQVGLENAKGKYVAFTDSDCTPESNWLENLVKGFESNIVGVGGGIKDVGTGLWGRSISIVMNTFLGSANSVQGRIFKKKKFVRSISGCNSMYLRETLMKIGGFNPRLSTNEDTDLNRRLSEVGRLLYVPDALITHNHGRRMKKFAERIFEFGKGRGSLFLWDWQFIPPIIVGLLILSLALSPWPLIAAICIYVFVVVAMGLKITIQEKRLEYLVSVPVVYLVEHSSYSFGIWTGLLESVLKRLFARGSAV